MTVFDSFTRAMVHAEVDALLSPGTDVTKRLYAYLRMDGGLKRGRHFVKLEPARRVALWLRARSGESRNLLAAEYGVTKQTVHNILNELGR